MLNRTHFNDYENTHFPLVYPDSVFPDNLVSWISLLVPDPFSRIALYTVRSHKGELSVSIGIYTADGIIPYAYYVGEIPEHRVCSLVSEDTKKPVGYIYMGSGVHHDCDLVGPVDVDPVCCVYEPADSTSPINGKPVHTPDVLNIKTSGCISIDADNSYTLVFVPTVDPSDLDGRDRLTYGCISTINSMIIPDHTLTINLPPGCTATYTVDRYGDMLSDPYRNTPIDRVVITIKDGSYGSADYGCAVNDPIMDILYPVTYDNSHNTYEKPLDRYINAYVNWFKSNYMTAPNKRTQDTAVVDGYDVYTYDNNTQFSEAPRISGDSNISISDGSGVSVLVKHVDDNGNISWE